MRTPKELHNVFLEKSKSKVAFIAWNNFITEVQQEAYRQGINDLLNVSDGNDMVIKSEQLLATCDNWL